MSVLARRRQQYDQAVQLLAPEVVVSNHGGRQLDRAVSSAVALPEVLAAVGGRALVLVGDGADVPTALALGASAVLVGRPVLWPLAPDGAAGVELLVVAYRDDLRHTMQLVSASSLTDLTPDLVTGH